MSRLLCLPNCTPSRATQLRTSQHLCDSPAYESGDGLCLPLFLCRRACVIPILFKWGGCQLLQSRGLTLIRPQIGAYAMDVRSSGASSSTGLILRDNNELTGAGHATDRPGRSSHISGNELLCLVPQKVKE